MTSSTPPTSPVQPPNPAQLADLGKIAQEQARAVLRKLPLLGPITWLMMQQSATRNLLLGDLEWRIMPALVLDQARLHMKDESPIAFVTWAKLSVEAADRYRRQPHRLVPSDWKSGEQIWIVDLVAPFGGARELIVELKEKVFAGQSLRQLAPMSDGLADFLEW
jgi:cytolysin-activating lysine-acyltransferase